MWEDDITSHCFNFTLGCKHGNIICQYHENAHIAYEWKFSWAFLHLDPLLWIKSTLLLNPFLQVHRDYNISRRILCLMVLPALISQKFSVQVNPCFPEKILGYVLCMFLQSLCTDWRFEGWYWKICAPEKSSCPFSALCWKSQLHHLVILDWVLEQWHTTLDLSHTLTIIRVVKNWFGWRKLTYFAYISILSMLAVFGIFHVKKSKFGICIIDLAGQNWLIMLISAFLG